MYKVMKKAEFLLSEGFSKRAEKIWPDLRVMPRHNESLSSSFYEGQCRFMYGLRSFPMLQQIGVKQLGRFKQRSSFQECFWVEIPKLKNPTIITIAGFVLQSDGESNPGYKDENLAS